MPERLIMDAVSNTLAWRKVGIVFWSVVVSLPLLIVVGLPWWLFFILLGVRLTLLCQQLYKYNGIRYYARIGLLAIDVTIFTLAFISTEWYQYVLASFLSWTHLLFMLCATKPLMKEF